MRPGKTFLARGLMATLMLLALAAFGFASLRAAPAAHAAGTPAIVQSASASDVTTNATSRNVTLTSVATGDLIEVTIGLGGGNAWGIFTAQQQVAGNSAHTLSPVASTSDGLNDYAFIYEGTALESGNDTITISWQESCFPNCTSTFVQSTITAYEISGQSAGADASATHDDNGGGGTTHTTGSTLTATANGSNELDLAIYTDAGANTSLSVPTGETEVGSKHDTAVSIEWDNADAAGKTAFEFDTSASAGYAAVAAVSIPG